MKVRNVIRLTGAKMHPPEWYKERDRRGPGKVLRKARHQKRLQRLLRFQWALRKIWAAARLWKALDMKPSTETAITAWEQADYTDTTCLVSSGMSVQSVKEQAGSDV